MKLLSDVDVDEVSPVFRAANRRRVVLKEETGVDAELNDIAGVPWEREGALLDEIRKEITDGTVEKAFVVGVRLLKGIEGELSREMVEKLGAELYGRDNPKLNSGGVPATGELTGSGSAEDHYGSASGAAKDGSGRDGELIGSGKAPKVSADTDDDTEPDDDEDEMAKAEALPDGSYPIKNTSDLKNAIQAYGRAKDKNRAKAWITRRARALGATGMLPDSWKVSKADDSESEMDVIGDEGGTVEVQVPVRKEDGTWDLSGVPSESRPFFEEMILKADEHERELGQAKERLAKADDELRTREMIEKAAEYSHVAPADELATVLKAAHASMDSETFGKLETLLSAAEERISKGRLFEESGRREREDPDSTEKSAYSEAVRKAAELVEKEDNPMSEDQALARVFESNPDLYSKYLRENGMGVS